MQVTGKIAQQGFRAFTQKYALRSGRRIPRIWIIVADAHNVRIFSKPDGYLELIGEAFAEDIALSDISKRNAGRTASSARGNIRHIYEPHIAQSRLAEAFFVQNFAAWLEDAEEAGTFDRLVLIASPHVLGSLRGILGKKVQSRVVAEIDKNLTRLNEKELYEALNKILWF